MLRYTIFSAIFVLVNVLESHSLQPDYYWREYTGSIPDDAVVGGQDIDGKNIYIGQAYVRGGGLIVAEIFPGVREVEAPFHEPHTIDTNIKILCGRPENFYWAPGKATDLNQQLIGKHAVIGGFETPDDTSAKQDGVLNIGRISHRGEIKIGKITSYLEYTHLYYAYKGKELRAGTFEILLYAK